MLVMISEAQSLGSLDPPLVNDFIVKRRTPGGLDPIHNPGPPLVNDFIMKRRTPRGPDPIHNLDPHHVNDFIVKM
ncbi:hypothetical protein V6N13_073472 [Hibiscus sabdariffa]